MSQVKISGNASGTGVLTISAPNTNTDRTLSLPDSAGEISTNKSTPMFSAKYTADHSTNYIATGTWTIIQYDTEIIDTEGWYDHTTYKFTPQQAGYYVLTFNGQVSRENASNDWFFMSGFLKNGSTANADTIIGNRIPHHGSSNVNASSFADPAWSQTTIMYFNGSTDFTGGYFYQNSGASTGHRFTSNGAGVFSGYLLRAV